MKLSNNDYSIQSQRELIILIVVIEKVEYIILMRLK